jgi:hypothetical protein
MGCRNNATLPSTVPTADSDDEFQPVNTSVAVKSRTSTPENSNNGAFLDSDIIIDIVTNASASETSIPRVKNEFIKYLGFIVFTSLKQYFVLAKLFKVKFTTTKISCDFLLTVFNIISFILMLINYSKTKVIIITRMQHYSTVACIMM